MSHTLTLVIAYAAICALWWGLSCVVPLWRQVERPTFSRPWAEVGLAFGGGHCSSGSWPTMVTGHPPERIWCMADSRRIGEPVLDLLPRRPVTHDPKAKLGERLNPA